MATKIIHKKSSVAASVPVSADIAPGELALNLADQKIYSKQTDGTIIEMAPNTDQLALTENCKNVSGGSLAIGTPVYQSGTAGNAMEVQAARADTAGSMPAVGILAQTLADEAEGTLVLTGFVQGFDTSSFSEGDTLYIAATGGLTTTPPAGEANLIQNIGKVIKVHASNGSIMVTGAGRANATPNLNDGDTFIGNGSNQAVTASFNATVDAHLNYSTATSGQVLSYNGSDYDWISSASGDLLSTNNLSELTNAATARTNLGLGTAATTNSTAYATAAQGSLADSALQSYTVSEGDVTAHQAALSITESQISDLGSYLTAHPNITAATSVNNTGRTYIQDITLDSNGHITGLVSATETVTDTNTTYTVGDGGLTQKNFTTTLKTKLDGIAASATNTAAPAISTNGSTPSLASGITAAEVRSLIGAGTSSSDNATHTGEVTGSTSLTIAADVVDAGNLKVTGNGTTSQFLRSDGDGSFTWATPTDTNTTYSVGDGGLTQKNFTTTLKTKLDGIAASATNTAAPAISTNGSTPSLASGITAAEVRSLIGAGTSSSNNATHTGEVTGSAALTIASNVVDADNLKVTGNGTTSQFLRSDGDGSFTWATPTDTNTVYSHPTHPGDDMSVDTGALTGATVISDLDFNVTTDTLGHVTDANATVSTRNLTLANLGYTGATNANYITNNNQLTNGAGYVTTDTNTTYSAGTGMSLSGTTFNCTIDSPSEVGLGNLSSSGNNLSGSFTATGNITAYSDIRIKSNIEVIHSALDKVGVIRGVTYDRTDIETERQTGVIAQEVQAVLPEAVIENADGTLSVAYGQMVGLLVEAIKELTAKVEKLEGAK